MSVRILSSHYAPKSFSVIEEGESPHLSGLRENRVQSHPGFSRHIRALLLGQLGSLESHFSRLEALVWDSRAHLIVGNTDKT